MGSPLLLVHWTTPTPGLAGLPRHETGKTISAKYNLPSSYISNELRTASRSAGTRLRLAVWHNFQGNNGLANLLEEQFDGKVPAPERPNGS